MVGLVVVSHSVQAATGIREIALEMGGDVPIEAVGGTDDGRIGTTPGPIEAAIERLTADGHDVLVIADLGSAVMNAELAIEAVDVDCAVTIADAPILEGTLNAAVTASGSGATLESALEAAESAGEISKL